MCDTTAVPGEGDDTHYYELDAKTVDGLVAALGDLTRIATEMLADADEGNDKSIFYAIDEIADLLGVEQP